MPQPWFRPAALSAPPLDLISCGKLHTHNHICLPGSPFLAEHDQSAPGGFQRFHIWWRLYLGDLNNLYYSNTERHIRAIITWANLFRAASKSGVIFFPLFSASCQKLVLDLYFFYHRKADRACGISTSKTRPTKVFCHPSKNCISV